LKAIGKQQSKDSLMSTLRKHVGVPKLTVTFTQPLNAEHCEHYIVSDSEHESEPALLASKKVII
jgi:hypothetical protein